MRSLSFWMVYLLICIACVPAAYAVYQLPPARSVVWRGNVGILNDIPRRTVVFRTLRPSGKNDTAVIQAALATCPPGQVVQLLAGTFVISSPITIRSGITLRGAGLGSTVIKGATSIASRGKEPYLVGIDNGYSLKGTVDVVPGARKGTTIVRTASRHGWKIGDLVLIDQRNTGEKGRPAITNVGNNGVCGWCGRRDAHRDIRSSGQIAKITGVPAPTVATIEIPLYYDYRNSPQATALAGIVTMAGIEDLTIDNSLSGNPRQNGTVQMAGTSNCWLYRVEVIGSYGFILFANGNYRDTVRGCTFHEGVPATPYSGPAYDGPSSRGNGLYFNTYNSANLIENNTMYHLSQPFFFSGATSGNVVSYNYIPVLHRSDNPKWSVDPINFHGAHPMMNLVEGNYTVGRLIADDVHGSSSHNTFFRNRTALAPNTTGGMWDVELENHCQYFNLVGNVLGTVGVETYYQLENRDLTGKEKSVYRFGYRGDGDGTAAGNDPQVLSTVLRHGNWDAVTNGVVWGASVDRSLPASLYLKGKPEWWGDLPWPCIGPDVTPMYPMAVEAGKGTPWCRLKPSTGTR